MGYLGRGKIYSKNGDCKKAINDFSEAIKQDEYNIEAYKERGRCYIATSKFDDALKEFQEYEHKKPLDAEKFMLVGDAQAGKEDYKSAASSYRLALDILISNNWGKSLSDSDLILKRDILLKQVKAYSTAENYFDGTNPLSELIKMYPNEGSYQLQLGQFLEKLNMLADADQVYKKAYQINPELPVVSNESELIRKQITTGQK